MYPYMSKPKLERKIDIPSNIVKDLLTPSEVRMVKQRLHIINLLDEGLSVRAVADRAKVGTDTVVRVSRMKNRSLNIQKFLGKSPTPVSPNKWVFGKAEED